jgi:glycerol-3-phosphate acyltransferase PlsX
VISVDAMGGDTAPRMVVEGCATALVRHPNARFLLFGDESALKPLLDEFPKVRDAAEIRHADDVVAMDAKPSTALRQGKKSSMWLALEAVKGGDAGAAISAGNTGALMAMAKIQLRLIEGIDRPALAAIWPTMRGESIVLDVGANVDCDEKMLVENAIMGEAFARAILGVRRPSVGLLNVGSEELKGTPSLREADKILKESHLHMDFQGFVEGDDISKGSVDVVVTDGFTGNVALKSAEGTAQLISSYLNTALRRSIFSKAGAFLAQGAFKILKSKMDPRKVNGGTFLGLNGTVVKSHGGTDGTGFASALDLAIDMAQSSFQAEIEQALVTLSETAKTFAAAQAAQADTHSGKGSGDESGDRETAAS